MCYAFGSRVPSTLLNVAENSVSHERKSQKIYAN